VVTVSSGALEQQIGMGQTLKTHSRSNQEEGLEEMDDIDNIQIEGPG